MNLIVVILLAALWAFLLLPGLLRARRHASPASSVDQFVRSMDLLARTRQGKLPPGRQVLVLPPRPGDARADVRTAAAQQRKAVVQVLAFMALGAGLLGFAVGGVAWWVAAASAIALLGYVAVAVHVVWREEQLRRTVRQLRPPQDWSPEADPPPAERVAEGGPPVTFGTRTGG